MKSIKSEGLGDSAKKKTGVMKKPHTPKSGIDGPKPFSTMTPKSMPLKKTISSISSRKSSSIDKKKTNLIPEKSVKSKPSNTIITRNINSNRNNPDNKHLSVTEVPLSPSKKKPNLSKFSIHPETISNKEKYKMNFEECIDAISDLLNKGIENPSCLISIDSDKLQNLLKLNDFIKGIENLESRYLKDNHSDTITTSNSNSNNFCASDDIKSNMLRMSSQRRKSVYELLFSTINECFNEIISISKVFGIEANFKEDVSLADNCNAKLNFVDTSKLNIFNRDEVTIMDDFETNEEKFETIKFPEFNIKNVKLSEPRKPTHNYSRSITKREFFYDDEDDNVCANKRSRNSSILHNSSSSLVHYLFTEARAELQLSLNK